MTPGDAGQGKTILLVEDLDDTRTTLTAILEWSGYRVVAVEHGQAALDVLDAGPAPDLILLDMLMPVLDGWHFLERVQRSPAPVPPIIVITATILTREWAESKGCAGFVRKPADPEELLAEVRRCLE